MVTICNFVTTLTHIIYVMSQQGFGTKRHHSKRTKIANNDDPIRACLDYKSRGHGYARTTQQFIWVSLDGNYVRNEFYSRQYIFKNNHEDNCEPLCPDHKNIIRQIITCSLDQDT